MSVLINCLNVQSRNQSRTLIVTVQGGFFGLQHDDNLESLQLGFEDLSNQLESARNVIVNLAEVSMFGASFLQVLFKQLAPFRMLGIQFVLCGDQTGLVSMTAMNRWLTVSRNIDDALASMLGTRGN